MQPFLLCGFLDIKENTKYYVLSASISQIQTKSDVQKQLLWMQRTSMDPFWAGLIYEHLWSYILGVGTNYTQPADCTILKCDGSGQPLISPWPGAKLPNGTVTVAQREWYSWIRKSSTFRNWLLCDEISAKLCTAPESSDWVAVIVKECHSEINLHVFWVLGHRLWVTSWCAEWSLVWEPDLQFYFQVSFFIFLTATLV